MLRIESIGILYQEKSHLRALRAGNRGWRSTIGPSSRAVSERERGPETFERRSHTYLLTMEINASSDMGCTGTSHLHERSLVEVSRDHYDRIAESGDDRTALAVCIRAVPRFHAQSQQRSLEGL